MKRSRFTRPAFGLLLALLAANAFAADYKANPFMFTYDGAITENLPGKV